ncbi:hypothetical protein LOAG_11532, partial [Loa loa]
MITISLPESIQRITVNRERERKREREREKRRRRGTLTGRCLVVANKHLYAQRSVDKVSEQNCHRCPVS